MFISVPPQKFYHQFVQSLISFWVLKYFHSSQSRKNKNAQGGH